MVIATGQRPQSGTTRTYEQGRECQQRGGGEADRGAHGPARRARDGARTPGGIAEADTPERIAKRVERCAATAPTRRRPRPDGPPQLLEKIINTADFVGIRYLDAGVAAARADRSRQHPRRPRAAAGLRHRLARLARAAADEPPRAARRRHRAPQRDRVQLPGRHRRPAAARRSVLPFDPDRFFLADDERDFALVAVRATPAELAPFGFNRLIEAEGKAIIGEFVTIVQHPRGEKKQVALRENKIVDMPEPVPALLGRHRARLVGLARVQRPVGGRRAAPRERARARAPRARRVRQRGHPDQPDRQVHQGAAAAAEQRALADQIFAPGASAAASPIRAAGRAARRAAATTSAPLDGRRAGRAAR